MWEIFSLGKFPYEGLENTDICRYLREGQRLEKVPLASDIL